MMTIFLFCFVFFDSLLSMCPQKMCVEQVNQNDMVYGPPTNPNISFLYRNDLPADNADEDSDSENNTINCDDCSGENNEN